MGSGLAHGGIEFVVAAYAITYAVLVAMLARAIGAVRRARAEYDSARKGEFRT